MFKPWYKQLINMDVIELKLINVSKIQPIAIASLLAFLAITSFPQPLKCEISVVASFRMVPYLQYCYALVVMSNAVYNY